ncbi:hypothetical protein CI266_005044 [Salmonella enterica subsp. enterica serovar Kotte]|nr:hypothetical protein [Salmonella enterica subsp. enterica serovar Kotte]
MSVTTTVTTNKKESQENKVVHNVFYIDMIPDAMKKMGWDMAPKLMKNWFSISPSYAFTEENKKENLNADATKLESSRVNSDIVKMSWAINYEQVSSSIDTLKKKWKSINGIERLKKLLKNKGDYNKASVEIGYTDDVKVLDATSQVNTISIGSKFDTVNDWYGAMGNANLKVCVRGKTEARGECVFFLVEKLGIYLKDTYDFLDQGSTSEPLGIWSRERILNKEETAVYMSSYLSGLWGGLARSYSGFVPVFNSDFRKWQIKYNKGGDFIVFSDVLWFFPGSDDNEIFLE